MASETVDPIDRLLPPPSWAVLTELVHSINRYSLCRKSTLQPSACEATQSATGPRTWNERGRPDYVHGMSECHRTTYMECQGTTGLRSWDARVPSNNVHGFISGYLIPHSNKDTQCICIHTTQYGCCMQLYIPHSKDAVCNCTYHTVRTLDATVHTTK